MIDVVIGIDLGGTFTKFGLITRSGETLASGSIPTDRFDKVEEYQDDLAGAIREMMQNLVPDVHLLGMGIGAPNANYYKGTIEYAANLKWKGVVPFVDMFRRFFDVPMVITNDANAAAIGEMVYGGARDMMDFIVITLGTGLGSGIVSNGKLVYGHDGFAGEIGHTCAVRNGRQCGCSRKGCLETYVSASGICRTFFELMAGEPQPSMLSNVGYDSLTSQMVAEAAQKGDALALKTFEVTGSMLGAHLSDSVAYTSPEAIFLCGGVAKAGNLIFEPTRRSFENHLLNIYKGNIQILPSGLPDSNVGVLGAGALIWAESIT